MNKWDKQDMKRALWVLPLMVLLAAWLSSLAPRSCWDMNGNPCRVEAQP